MTRRAIAITTAFLAGFAPVLLKASAALFQEEEKKSDTKKIEVHVKVSGESGEQIPARTKIKISGQEKACGALYNQDAEASTGANGVASFSALPMCRVAVKVNVDGYINKREEINLADYRSSDVITIRLTKER